jgi:hypothetical protein
MDFLTQFEKLSESEDQDKLKLFKIRIDVTIDAYAEIADYLKKQHYRWNRNTEELCLLRGMIQKKIKETSDGN